MQKSFKILLILSAIFLHGCSLAPLKERTNNLTLPYDEISQSSLYQSIEALSEEYDGLSGIYPLGSALEAFISRVLLVRESEKTLDIQYYIWRKDNTGALLLYEILLAADRGVRVRLLLDDLGSYGIDSWLSVLNEHPNIEVRLFNPFSSRKTRFFDFVTNFNRANRRMHNKSITADQSMTIVGGRNIGDEYFAATDGVLFSDLDILAIGKVAEEVGKDFDRYWISRTAYPVEQLFSPKKDKELVLEEIRKVFIKPESIFYAMALQDAYFASDFGATNLPFEWVNVRLVSDDPIKGKGLSKESDLLMYRLEELLEHSIEKLDLVSPYFVPAKSGTQAFVDLVAEGAQVRVLTNAQEATDVTPVHSGYIKRRKALLKAGVDIFEMKNRPDLINVPYKSGGLSLDGFKNSVFGSSGTSLHAKTFAINKKQLFVGSFNFDPRSAHLNTELGFLIDSPSLATKINDVFVERILDSAYQVKLDDRGKIYWLEKVGDKEIIHRKEPGTSWLKRSWVRLLSWLPIDWLL